VSYPYVPNGPASFDGSDWNDLRKATEGNGGVLRITMGILRDLEEAKRLGPNVCASISRHLAGVGLSHLPFELPSYQEDQVVIFQLGKPAADVVEAVRGDNLAKAETSLRALNTKGGTEKLAKIRAILDDED
jgi:hypothetical protein